uniref:Uncharacterized protein n=1 Tax=Palpitomonas bilix TaxID=652834 RepID=A0A7S3LX65_9EUKA|mmetsp:Transcript_7722/g.20047  ORF Transcript_7722/g.20047 Transcript_7722/m.20047 type:complete len:119 (+) Transcript_7722:52-408(+)
MKTGVVRTILAVALLSLFASPVSAADEVDASTCGQNTDCSSCVGMAGCGWCEYTSTCSSGSSSGPTSGSCGEGWAYYSSKRSSEVRSLSDFMLSTVSYLCVDRYNSCILVPILFFKQL